MFVSFCSMCYRVHYPGTLSTKPAVDLGTALWASEDFSTFNDEVGGGCWARVGGILSWFCFKK